MQLPAIEAALRRALADPAVRADASACRIAVTLQVADPAPAAARELVLWPGRDAAGEVRCRATPAVWERVFAPVPPVGYQSFGALRRRPDEFAVEGSDLHWAQALPLMERLLEAMRSPRAERPAAAPRHLDALPHLRGRYLALAGQEPDWVFSEECGRPEAPALLMLHTAGADARQWHGLMAQEALREQWRLLAFDLPGHGRSPLPAGEANWNWRLDQQRYIGWVLRYLDALQLERVVLVGCSMGAAIGLPLLARHADRFHGAILLETPYRAPGRRSPYLNHAEVHGARLGAAWVGALLSPTSPASGRDHATWIYSQGAPGVYDGDLAFYSDEFDAHRHTAAIDTERTPVWLLTGDYDYSASPADSRRVAAEMPGAHFQELRGFGHFPMVESPDALLPHLAGPLAALREHILNPARRTP